MATDQSTTVSPNVEYRLVPDYPGYRVGDDGSVWTCWRRRYVPGTRVLVLFMSDVWKLLKTTRSSYKRTVKLYRNGKGKTHFVHSLVAKVFLGDRPNGMEVCHYDGNASNNAVSNLRYDTPAGNTADKVRHGTIPRGSCVHNAKLKESDIGVIRIRLANGETLLSIANDYGVDFTVISAIKRRKAWGWLD
jgi:hypothetical protein